MGEIEARDTEKIEYEVSFLVRDEEGVAEVTRLITQHGGRVTFEGGVRKLPLAYRVEKETHAHFGYFYAYLEPKEANTLLHDLKTSGKILRTLIIKSPVAKEKEGSVVPRQRFGVAPVARPQEPRTPLPLSNEALEKKIEEILQ